MYGAIITKLKTGSITNVVPYGSTRPSPPYVVVKPEKDPFDRGRRWGIYIHAQQGEQAFLEDYCFDELIDLLDNFEATTRNNNVNRLLIEQEYQDIITNDDGTISMARYFLMPSRTF